MGRRKVLPFKLHFFPAYRLPGKLIDMKNTYLFVLIIATLFSRQANAQSLPKDSLVKLRNFINSALEKQGIPALSFAVVRNDSLLIEEGFGYADREKKIPAKASTAYAVGSVTKTMTIAALG
jgi:CubicO group peptidase (beta-lactamase class C family)